MSIVVDSGMTREDILAQNPESPAPRSVISALDILAIEYCGFDGARHAGQIVVRKDVAQDVEKFFGAALETGFPIEKVIPISNKKYRWNDEVSCDDNNSSGYNYRLIWGTNRLSNHAAGLAFDVNPIQNPYGGYDKNLNEIFRFPKGAVYDRNAPGTLTGGHPLVRLMKNLGWRWGGDWKKEEGRIDYQHFEKIL